MLKASAFGGRGYIPLPYLPPMASKAGHAQLCRRLFLLNPLTEHPPYKIPGYAPVNSNNELPVAIMSQSLSTFENTRCQKKSCLLIKLSVEYSRKLKTNANPGFFFRSFELV